MLKRQEFEDSENDATEPKTSKCPRVDRHNSEEGQSSEKYQDKGGRYVPLCPYPQKESNRPTDLSKGTKSINHLICIPKLPYRITTNFVLEFAGRKGSKAQKKIYTNYLQEGMVFYLAFTTFTAFGITNARHLIKERLESYCPPNYCQGLESQPCPNQ